VYSSGDANSNNLLDLGETWVYTANRTVTIGQYTGIAIASGQDSISQQVAAPDLTHYLGVLPNNADFNEDTIVDSADYILWRMNNGLTGGATHSQGDANHDGNVNGDDYDIWRSQFGTSPAGSGASQEYVVASSLAIAATHDAALTAVLNDGHIESRGRNSSAPTLHRTASRFRGPDWTQLLTILSANRVNNRANVSAASPAAADAKADDDDQDGKYQASGERPLQVHFARIGRHW
jgi:hypothetical protein